MKSTITISLDTELIKRIREIKGYSDWINKQLWAILDIKNMENLEILNENLQKTKQIIKENNKKRREIEAKMDKIKQKETKILKKIKSKAILIREIIEKRKRINSNPYRKIDFMISPEEEAEQILKGGKSIT